jgi:CRISPR-associated protein Cas2
MWMMVLFDLPVLTKQQRKQATKFRKSLLDYGFSMAQYSVYYKLIPSKDIVDAYVNKIQTALPQSGKVDILMITDKQYENIISFSGSAKEHEKKKNPTQLVLF